MRRQRSPRCKLIPGRSGRRRPGAADQRARRARPARSSPPIVGQFAGEGIRAPAARRSAACGVTGAEEAQRRRRRRSSRVGKFVDVGIAQRHRRRPRCRSRRSRRRRQNCAAKRPRRWRGSRGSEPHHSAHRHATSGRRAIARRSRLALDVQHVVDLVLVRRRTVEVDRSRQPLSCTRRSESAASASCRASVEEEREHVVAVLQGGDDFGDVGDLPARCATRWSRC